MTIKKLQRSPKVDYVEDERAIGNGIIITLSNHWAWLIDDSVQTMGFDTMKDAAEGVADAFKR